MATALKTDTEIGLTIGIALEEPSGDGPMTMAFHYMLDTLKFKKWLKDHSYLCTDGPLGFTVKGIRVLLEAGADKWDKAGFSIDNGGEPFFLNLLHEEEIFKIHRDLFNKKEWSITYIDKRASQTQTYG